MLCVNRLCAGSTGEDSSLQEDRLRPQTTLKQMSERGESAMLRQVRYNTPPLERKSDSVVPVSRSLSLSKNSTEIYSVFVRDTALVWSAIYRYVTGAGAPSSLQPQDKFRAFLTSDTLLPYHPPAAPGADRQQELQVPMDMRRSLRARSHNEIKEGFPSVLFLNPDTMDITSNSQAPLYQALYFLEFGETGTVATPCYVIKSALERRVTSNSYPARYNS